VRPRDRRPWAPKAPVAIPTAATCQLLRDGGWMSLLRRAPEDQTVLGETILIYCILDNYRRRGLAGDDRVDD
jgi:hypothetical protein